MSERVPKRAHGGIARARSLEPEKRSEIASAAARARWEAKRAAANDDAVPHVLEDYAKVVNLAGVRIPCAVIKGPAGIQRVLSEHGITNALLGSRSGASKKKKKVMEDQGAPVPLFLALGS